jgi:hypothetical protein
VLGYADLLSLRDGYLHSADGAAVVGHRGYDDMALLVKAVVKAHHLRLEFAMERVDGVVERIEVAAVSGLMMFIARKNQLLKLPQYIDLAFHRLLPFCEYSYLFKSFR